MKPALKKIVFLVNCLGDLFSADSYFYLLYFQDSFCNFQYFPRDFNSGKKSIQKKRAATFLPTNWTENKPFFRAALRCSCHGHPCDACIRIMRVSKFPSIHASRGHFHGR